MSKCKRCKCDRTERKQSVLPLLSPYPGSEDALNASIIESAALKHEDVSGSAGRSRLSLLNRSIRVRISVSPSYGSRSVARVNNT